MKLLKPRAAVEVGGSNRRALGFFSLLLPLPLSNVPVKMSHSEVSIFVKKMLNFVAWERQD